MPRADEADLLQIAVRSVVIELTRIGISAKTGAALEVTVCVIPADRVEIIMPLVRDRSAQWPSSASRT
jgi:GntR family transcriptional regulator